MTTLVLSSDDALAAIERACLTGLERADAAGLPVGTSILVAESNATGVYVPEGRRACLLGAVLLGQMSSPNHFNLDGSAYCWYHWECARLNPGTTAEQWEEVEHGFMSCEVACPEPSPFKELGRRLGIRVLGLGHDQ